MLGDDTIISKDSKRTSTVYGPVRSWRYGRSLGVDPIVDVSTCSFNCIYCQLGNIMDVTTGRREFVPTAHVFQDLEKVDWKAVDVVTISGSGEPTLATNLGEIAHHIKTVYDKPLHILTNATLFHSAEVRGAVAEIDVVSCKLDGATEAVMEKINRPAAGVTLASIVSGIMKLKQEYRGRLELQIMFMPLNSGQIEDLVRLILQIAPDEVQVNTPTRPYPLQWNVETRGAHGPKISTKWPTRKLKAIQPDLAQSIEARIREATGVPAISVYREPRSETN